MGGGVIRGGLVSGVGGRKGGGKVGGEFAPATSATRPLIGIAPIIGTALLAGG